MLSRRQGEALGADDPRVLEIALAPSPVASREIDERGRALFVRAAEVGQHVNGKARAPHQARLDEIVAEDVAAERRLARQVRQSAMVGERARTDDRVVAPVVAVPPHPRAQTRADHRAGHPGRELLQPREHGVAVDDERLALDDAGVGIRLHRRREAHDRLAGHQTVGVEDDHMRIVAAPVSDEIGDVARFAGQILAPPSVVEAGLRQACADGDESALFGDPDIGVGGVGQQEEVERVRLAGAFDVLEDRLHGAEHARRRLVVDRHHDRRPFAQARRRLASAPMSEKPDKADDGGGKRERHPGKRDDEQHHHRPFKRSDRADRDNPEHLVGAICGQGQGAAENEEPGQNRRAREARRDQRSAIATREPLERLHRHGERREARHRGAERRAHVARPGILWA